MVHTLRRFTAPNEANARKTFLVVSSFADYINEKSIIDVFREKNLSKFIKNKESIDQIDELARNPKTWDGHFEIYCLYHSEIKKNKENLYKNLNNSELIFLPVFSTLVSEPKKHIYDKIRVQTRTSVGQKKGFDSFSGLHKISKIVENAERENSLKHNSNFVYLTTSPILTFGRYDKNTDLVRNHCNELCETDILGNVNKILYEKNKKTFDTNFLEKFKSGLYQVNQAFYDAYFFKNYINNESEYTFAKNIALYNQLLTSVLWSEIMQNINQKSFYYFGEKSNPSYNILSKACALSEKNMLPIKIMQNTKIPVTGACAPEALNKFLGYFNYKNILDSVKNQISNNNYDKNYKISDFFKEKNFKRFFNE